MSFHIQKEQKSWLGLVFLGKFNPNNQLKSVSPIPLSAIQRYLTVNLVTNQCNNFLLMLDVRFECNILLPPSTFINVFVLKYKSNSQTSTSTGILFWFYYFLIKFYLKALLRMGGLYKVFKQLKASIHLTQMVTTN